MKASNSIAKATVSLHEALDCPFLMNPNGRGKFLYLWLQNRLALATASPCAFFKHYLSKIDTRKMDEFYEYTA